MYTRSSLIGLLILLNGVAPISAEELHLELTSASKEVLLGETVRLKVCFQNRTEQEVRFDYPLGIESGTLKFEARHEEAEEFSGLIVKGDPGCIGFILEKRQYRLCRGESRVQHNVIGWTQHGPPLPHPGRWWLRVRIQDNDGISGVSSPIQIRVLAADDCQLKIARKGLPALFSIGRVSLSRYLTSKQLEPLLDSDLPALRSEAKLAHICLKMRSSSSRESLTESLNEVNAHLKEVDSLTREVFALVVADELIRLRQFDAASQFSELVPADSLDRRQLDRKIEQLRKQAEKQTVVQ